MEIDAVEGVEKEQTLKALYFNIAAFAGASIAFAVRVTLQRSRINEGGFTSTDFELLDIRPG